MIVNEETVVLNTIRALLRDYGRDPMDVLFALSSLHEPSVLMKTYLSERQRQLNFLSNPEEVLSKLDPQSLNHIATCVMTYGKVAGVKELRLLTGLGLKDAKELVEAKFPNELEAYHKSK